MYHLLQIKSLSTPTSRECAELKMLSAEVMVEIFEQHMTEVRDRQTENLRKGAVVKVSVE